MNLPAIETTLRRVQQDFHHLNAQLETPRDRLEDEVLENMLAGYAFIDRAIDRGLELLTLGNLKHLIELNTLVLCGEDPHRRLEYSKHQAATEQSFYDLHRGGIRDLMEWYEMHQEESI